MATSHESASLKTLKRQRASLKSQVTRIISYVNENTNPDVRELERRKVKLEELEKSYEKIQFDIEGEDEVSDHAEERNQFERQCYTTHSLLQRQLESLQGSSRNITSPRSQESPNIHIRNQTSALLPKIEIKPFDGNPIDWHSFRDMFMSLVHDNEDLPAVQKFHLLKSSLRGDVSSVIASLTASETNYWIEWNLLEDRCNKPRRIVNAHLKQLHELPEITRDSPANLRKLSEQAQMHVNALRSLGQSDESWDSFLVYIVVQRLDKNTRRAWERTLENDEVPKFETLIKFLNKQARGDDCDDSQASISRFSEQTHAKSQPFKRNAHVATTWNRKCIVCKDTHELYTCEQFLQLPIQERINTVKMAKLCLNCMRDNHSTNNCRGRNCRKCNRRHNTLLHLPLETRQNRDPVPSTSSVQNIKTTLTASCNSESLLGTAQVIVLDKFNKEHSCRVLLDAGSQAHFITERLGNKLKLDKYKTDLTFSGLGHLNSGASFFVKTLIKGTSNAFESQVTLIALPTITGLLPSRQVDRSTINIPKNISQADPEFHKPGEIDILLGVTLFYKLLCVGQIRLNNSSIILQKTRLGWIVTGETNIQGITAKPRTLVAHVSSLDKQLNKFWEIEEVIDRQLLSTEEQDCETHFSRHTQRDTDGRYTVRLPFNNKKELLGKSRNIALKRFCALERRLHRTPELFEQYADFLKEYESLGHMRVVTDVPLNEGFYLPHHAVIKESSKTTKLRVVFDGSAKSSTGISLNDTLMIGPTIQDTLSSIILWFRKHTYVFTADIEKMYRQIRLHSDDTNYQRILWREGIDNPIRTFALNTVTYGTVSGPFLATRCLKQLADDEYKTFALAARILKRDCYVDDVITGTSNFEEALKLQGELIELTKLGGLHLRQWTSNSLQLTKGLDTRNDQEVLYFDPSEAKKTLGACWSSSEDTIVYSIKPFEGKQRVTKRTILPHIAQLLDPLGLLGPVIVKGKVIMQQLWKEDLGWDESVPEHIYLPWLDFRAQLDVLNSFVSPRQAIISQATQVQLHGFCDASERAYGACIYIRSTNAQNTHQVNLLCAKSRVAPVKTIFLPRLELSAAKLLIQLFVEVTKSLSNIKFDKVKFWTDSTITIGWINTSPHLLNTFVANRVNEIQSSSDAKNRSHVASADNPADFISCGQSPAEFIHNRRWVEGPHWLIQREEEWPAGTVTLSEIPEKRKLVSLTTQHVSYELLTHYSPIKLLNRVVAYLLRFHHNCRNKSKRSGELTAEEIRKAHLRIIKLIQNEAFPSEIRDLSHKRQINTKSKILRLNPFIDDEGVLRVGGRLKHAVVDYSSKHPILLPRHHITNIITREAHIRQYHAGINATINALRQTYWPIDGRSTVKRVIHTCVRCHRFNLKTPEYVMGDLPESRVRQTRPFENVGIDYCGPYFIKEKKERNRKKVKAYVVVFVCFVTKATHLEVVADLTAESCIGVLRRFFARRGIPRHIYTDNATNFVGVKNEISQTHSELQSSEHRLKMQHFLGDHKINWHFSPPRSPHFGGLWEAAVKSFKKHLSITVGEGLLTYEVFNTLVIEIEGILNSRPLIPLSSDPNDLNALTPGHFLIGDSLTNSPEHDFTETRINKLSMWQHIQKIKQHFWKRWHLEYLQKLHTRCKWHLGDSNRFKEGMLVTIREDNLPPLHWKLGRIITIHPGEDNIVLVATIQTAHGTYKRSVKKLSPLPIDVPTSDKS